MHEVLKLFLPYHESPHFTKMLTILHIQPNSSWSFLLPYKSAAKPLTRNALVGEMQANTDVARFVTSLLPNAIRSISVHRTLLAFNGASLHDFVTNTLILDAGTLAHLLPALLEPLQNKSEHVTKEAIVNTPLPPCMHPSSNSTTSSAVIYSLQRYRKRYNSPLMLFAL